MREIKLDAKTGAIGDKGQRLNVKEAMMFLLGNKVTYTSPEDVWKAYDINKKLDQASAKVRLEDAELDSLKGWLDRVPRTGFALIEMDNAIRDAKKVEDKKDA